MKISPPVQERGAIASAIQRETMRTCQRLKSVAGRTEPTPRLWAQAMSRVVLAQLATIVGLLDLVLEAEGRAHAVDEEVADHEERLLRDRQDRCAD